MEENGLEDQSLYQDILDEVFAGRLEGHKCPVCQGDLECYADESKIKLTCGKCGRVVEGVLA
ncbi:MAG: hypothetical protein FJ088_01995 [Deltaproteobacteria bacterium]|nr:hypothetical protein [Deltaproteobacteria bacterium]